MTELETAVNIGSTLARELRAGGIDSVERLRKLGARRAWHRVRKVNAARDCASSLLALEGAVRGTRWMAIDPAERKRISEYAKEWKGR